MREKRRDYADLPLATPVKHSLVGAIDASMFVVSTARMTSGRVE
jgi:hypothetical protein